MHIPDGFLDAKTCLGTYCLAGAGLAWAAREMTARWTERTTPLLGVMSAFVFAGQMVNFPIAGGTSGHLAGGVLAAVLLGPAAAAMALTIVLAVQCLFFQDGGITALGANVLNMGLIGVGGGYLIFRGARLLFRRPSGLLPAVALAAWTSTVLGAAACALELAAAGTAPLRLVMPAMTITHALIGVGEALITVGVVSFVLKVRPDLLYEPSPSRAPQSLKGLAGRGLAVALGLALLLPPLASRWPDGLDRLAIQLGFMRQARPVGTAPFPDYTVPGMGPAWIEAAAAALIGTVLAFLVAWAAASSLARWWRRSRSNTQPE